jgi:Ni,Fe-hydrogenase I cytochrome b subunit
MSEFLKMIPLFFLSIFLIFISNYFIKKNPPKSNNNINSLSDFLNLQPQFLKILAIIILIVVILKSLYLFCF